MAYFPGKWKLNWWRKKKLESCSALVVGAHSFTPLLGRLLLYVPREKCGVCVPSSGYSCRGRPACSFLTYGDPRADLFLSCYLLVWPPILLSFFPLALCPWEHFKEARGCWSARERGMPLWWLKSFVRNTNRQPTIELLFSEVYPQKPIDHRVST